MESIIFGIICVVGIRVIITILTEDDVGIIETSNTPIVLPTVKVVQEVGRTYYLTEWDMRSKLEDGWKVIASSPSSTSNHEGWVIFEKGVCDE